MKWIVVLGTNLSPKYGVYSFFGAVRLGSAFGYVIQNWRHICNIQVFIALHIFIKTVLFINQLFSNRYLTYKKIYFILVFICIRYRSYRSQERVTCIDFYTFTPPCSKGSWSQIALTTLCYLWAHRWISSMHLLTK